MLNQLSHPGAPHFFLKFIYLLLEREGKWEGGRERERTNFHGGKGQREREREFQVGSVLFSTEPKGELNLCAV